jgi:hypothetical protein
MSYIGRVFFFLLKQKHKLVPYEFPEEEVSKSGDKSKFP